MGLGCAVIVQTVGVEALRLKWRPGSRHRRIGRAGKRHPALWTALHLRFFCTGGLRRQRGAAVGTVGSFGHWRDLIAESQTEPPPIQAQVLVNPTTPHRIQVLGEEMSYESAESELLELKRELRDELGLPSFTLVEGGRIPPGAMMNLLALCKKLGTITSPCGIANFPDFADTSASGREPDAEPSDAPEPGSREF